MLHADGLDLVSKILEQVLQTLLREEGTWGWGVRGELDTLESSEFRMAEFVFLISNCFAFARSLNLGRRTVSRNQTGDLCLFGITWLPWICIFLVE